MDLNFDDLIDILDGEEFDEKPVDLKTLANQIAVMNRTFSDTMRSTGQFSTHFVSLTSDVDKFGRNLDTGNLS